MEGMRSGIGEVGKTSKAVEADATDLVQSPFLVHLNKSQGEPLGLQFDEATLEVVAVDIGLVQAWNLANPANAICVGTKLLEVNGHSSLDRALQELRDAERLEFLALPPRGRRRAATDPPAWPPTLAEVARLLAEERRQREAEVAELAARLAGAEALLRGPGGAARPRPQADAATQPAGHVDGKYQELAAAQAKMAKEQEAALRALTDHITEALEVQSVQARRTAVCLEEVSCEVGRRLQRLEEDQRQMGEMITRLVKEGLSEAEALGAGSEASPLVRGPERCLDEVSDGSVTHAPSTRPGSPLPAMHISLPCASRSASAACGERATQSTASGRTSLTSSADPCSGRWQTPRLDHGSLTLPGTCGGPGGLAAGRAASARGLGLAVLDSRSASPSGKAAAAQPPLGPPLAAPLGSARPALGLQQRSAGLSPPSSSSVASLARLAPPATSGVAAAAAKSTPSWGRGPVPQRPASPRHPSVSSPGGSPVMSYRKPLEQTTSCRGLSCVTAAASQGPAQAVAKDSRPSGSEFHRVLGSGPVRSSCAEPTPQLTAEVLTLPGLQASRSDACLHSPRPVSPGGRPLAAPVSRAAPLLQRPAGVLTTRTLVGVQ